MVVGTTVVAGTMRCRRGRPSRVKQREGRGSGEVLGFAQGSGSALSNRGAGAGVERAGVVGAGVVREGRGVWRGRGKRDRAKGYPARGGNVSNGAPSRGAP